MPRPHSIARRLSSSRALRRLLPLAALPLLGAVVFALSGSTAAHRTPALLPTAARLGPQLAPLGDPGRWQLGFDDEFSGRSVDLSRWRPNWLGGSDTAVTGSADPSDENCADPAQVAEAGGTLRLAAIARPCAVPGARPRAFASGLVETRQTFTTGFFEARIFIPTSRTGTPVDYPGFWAIGSGPWPSTGEIDVMEVLGHCGPGLGYYFTSAAGTRGGCVALGRAGGWHIFGIDWERHSLTVYYDGVAVGHVRRGVTTAPMALVLDNSVNARAGGPAAPSRLRVDYVRVWSPGAER